MKTIKVIPPGSSVKIGADIDGIIDQVVIKSYGVLYNVMWWNGAERKEGWFQPKEVTAAANACRQTIGFAEKGPNE